MQIRSTKLFGILTVAVLALALFAGNVLADTEAPAETSTPEIRHFEHTHSDGGCDGSGDMG